jgi:penicillin-binding protein 1B
LATGAYEPENYKQEYFGQVDAAGSLDVFAERGHRAPGRDGGIRKVRNLALAAGFNRGLLATPAIALGAYVASPLEVAGAYTIFSNGGTYVEPRFILAVNDASGTTALAQPGEARQVLDPRVAYLMVDLLESVINNGTGAGARARGFKLCPPPARPELLTTAGLPVSLPICWPLPG